MGYEKKHYLYRIENFIWKLGSLFMSIKTDIAKVTINNKSVHLLASWGSPYPLINQIVLVQLIFGSTICQKAKRSEPDNEQLIWIIQLIINIQSPIN